MVRVLFFSVTRSVLAGVCSVVGCCGFAQHSGSSSSSSKCSKLVESAWSKSAAIDTMRSGRSKFSCHGRDATPTRVLGLGIAGVQMILDSASLLVRIAS